MKAKKKHGVVVQQNASLSECFSVENNNFCFRKIMVYDQSVAMQDTLMQKAVEKMYYILFVQFAPVEI